MRTNAKPQPALGLLCASAVSLRGAARARQAARDLLRRRGGRAGDADRQPVRAIAADRHGMAGIRRARRGPDRAGCQGGQGQADRLPADHPLSSRPCGRRAAAGRSDEDPEFPGSRAEHRRLEGNQGRLQRLRQGDPARRAHGLETGRRRADQRSLGESADGGRRVISKRRWRARDSRIPSARPHPSAIPIRPRTRDRWACWLRSRSFGSWTWAI